MTAQRPSEALICLGSSSPLKLEAVEAAFAFVSRLGEVMADSGAYPTPPEGTPVNAEPYNNRVLCLATPLSLDRLRAACKEYEGGVRSRHAGPGVAVDIDIVTFDGSVLRPLDYGSAHMAKGMQIIKNKRKDGIQR